METTNTINHENAKAIAFANFAYGLVTKQDKNTNPDTNAVASYLNKCRNIENYLNFEESLEESVKKIAVLPEEQQLAIQYIMVLGDYYHENKFSAEETADKINNTLKGLADHTLNIKTIKVDKQLA